MLINFWENLIEIYLEIAPYLFIGLAFSGFLHILFKKDFIANHLGKSNFSSVIKASVLGVPLPLCSCGVIPTALYLRKQKASKGATLSFLISTPQTGIDSIIATYGMMGPVFAIFRPVIAFVMGIIGGISANLFLKNKKNEIAYDELDDAKHNHNSNHNCTSCSVTPAEPLTLKDKLIVGLKYAFVEFLDDISIQLIIGIVLAAIISFAIPDEFFVKYGGNGLPGMLIMMLFAIPLYVCATASIPIAVSLILKGISPGAALVFLITGPATNIATITLIARALGKKTIVVYLSVIALMAIASAYLLNFIFTLVGQHNLMNHIHEHADNNMLLSIITIIFSILLFMSLLRKVKGRYFNKSQLKEAKIMNNVKRFYINGMTCNHCVDHVKNAIMDVEGVTEAYVKLNEKSADVEGSFNELDVIKAIQKAGYKADIN